MEMDESGEVGSKRGGEKSIEIAQRWEGKVEFRSELWTE